MLVLVEVEDRVATVTLNRPEARNAISAELHGQLDAAITELDARDDVGCIVLTGPTRRSAPAWTSSRSPPSSARSSRSASGAPLATAACCRPTQTPVIGAINGPTVTGGLELAMCCDFLIASERARFADTHARVGVMPGGGMTIRLPQLVGIDRARRMSFTGDYIDAETARDWGLVVEVVPHESLLPRAREIAATIASIPNEYVRELRRGVRRDRCACAGPRPLAAENTWSRALDGGAVRPVPPGHRTREDRRPGEGAEHRRGGAPA